MEIFRKIRPLFLCAVSTVLFSQTATPNVDIWYPDQGDLAYDGGFKIDTRFEWTRGASLFFWIDEPLDAWISGRGFELDVILRTGYFTDCVGDSDFEEKYDDCETAGVSEPTGDQVAYSCGTYQGAELAIEPASDDSIFRYCNLLFTGGEADVVTTDVKVNGQLVYHKFCPANNPWCMGGEDSEWLNQEIHNSERFYIERGEVYWNTWGNWPYGRPNIIPHIILPLIINVPLDTPPPPE